MKAFARGRAKPPKATLKPTASKPKATRYGLALEVLMLLEGQTGGLGQAAGYVWESGEPFYGARVGVTDLIAIGTLFPN